jgi:hypothetical protein
MLRNFSVGIIFTIQLFCIVDNNAAHMNNCCSMWQNYEVHEKFKEGKNWSWMNEWMNEWMNGIWVQALLGPMHLDLRTGPLKKVKLLLCYQLVLYSDVVFLLKMIHFYIHKSLHFQLLTSSQSWQLSPSDCMYITYSKKFRLQIVCPLYSTNISDSSNNTGFYVQLKLQ